MKCILVSYILIIRLIDNNNNKTVLNLYFIVFGFYVLRYYLASLVLHSLLQDITLHPLQCAQPLTIANVFLEPKRSVPP